MDPMYFDLNIRLTLYERNMLLRALDTQYREAASSGNPVTAKNILALRQRIVDAT